MTTTCQVMPDLSAEQYAALKADIVEHGVLVPIVKDQHGNVIDGHNRIAIAEELGITVPVETKSLTPDEALSMAVTLNCARRHLTREQVRVVIANEIERCPDDSDRAIARRVGCSPSTVGAVRRPLQVSNLDTVEGAESRAAAIVAELQSARKNLLILTWEALSIGITPAEVVMRLTGSLRSMEKEGRDEWHVLRDLVMTPVIDYVMEPSTAEEFANAPTLSETERQNALEALRSSL